MSNIIIVESKNDKYFFQKMLSVMEIDTANVDNITNEIEYEELGGLGQLENKLKALKNKISKYEKIGIVLDADEEGITKRIELINKSLKKTMCSDVEFDKVNELKYSAELDVRFAVYITNVNNKGELETILKAVKSKNSDYADCLNSWRECLDAKGKEISDKDFDKFWVSTYFRYDTCNKDEKKQAGKKCTGEIAIKKDIWDFDHEVLSELKTFLQLFS